MNREDLEKLKRTFKYFRMGRDNDTENENECPVCGIDVEKLWDFIQKEKQISFDKGYESKMSKYHKAYYQANKEKMNARTKEYYRKNKALLKLKRWEKLNKESK